MSAFEANRRADVRALMGSFPTRKWNKMNLSVHEFTSRILPGLSDRQFAETPVEPEPRKPVKNFIADVRKKYAEKKKNLSSNDKRYRPSQIWYFFAIIFLVLSMQNFFVGTHVELISYSQFKALLKKDLISEIGRA